MPMMECICIITSQSSSQSFCLIKTVAKLLFANKIEH